MIAFLVVALSQLCYLYLGLRLISTSRLYPFILCVYNTLVVLGGLVSAAKPTAYLLCTSDTSRSAPSYSLPASWRIAGAWKKSQPTMRTDNHHAWPRLRRRPVR